ncbi:MAG: ABC transporter ATP-binding protein [Spirochaetaceae bacterium]
MNTLLESKQLSKRYRLGKNNEVSVLKDVDLRIHEGEFVSIMGPSGSGKSTLLYNLCGMERMSSGEVHFADRALSRLSEKELAQLRLTEMGFIFQQIHLLSNLTIFDNIILSGYLAKSTGRRSVDRRARELMEITGIDELAGNSIAQASGGQLQRVGICRALINEPRILFGDEPTGALDSRSATDIMDLLREVHGWGTTIILVTHDVKVAARSDRVLFMTDGRITAEKELGRYEGNGISARTREEELSSRLLEQAALRSVRSSKAPGRDGTLPFATPPVREPAREPATP